MVLKYCTQYVSKSGRPSSNHRTRKGQSSPLFPRRVVLKNVLTMRQLHPSSKVVLKILHARLKHYMNQELPDVQAGFRKERGTRDQIANICWIKEKAKVFQKTSTSVSATMPKPLTVWIIISCGKHLKRWEYKTILPVSWETCMWVKKKPLEPYMKQWSVQNWKKSMTIMILPSCLFNLYTKCVLCAVCLVAQSCLTLATHRL